MLPVIEGTEVVQGQLLARVRRRFKAAQVEQAQTALQLARSGASQLQADLALSYRELTRHRQPFERKLACVPSDCPKKAYWEQYAGRLWVGGRLVVAVRGVRKARNPRI